MKKLFNFLRNDSPYSSMRLTLTLIGIGVFAMMGAMAWTIATSDCEDTPYIGMTSLMGGISALVGTSFFGKVKQKQVEVNGKTKDSVSNSKLAADSDTVII